MCVQALSIRPDLLSPAAMVELQKLCDKVPSFDSGVAMRLIEDELGRPWREVYAELTPEPIAAASLGQVYKGRLKNGHVVAVKVRSRLGGRSACYWFAGGCMVLTLSCVIECIPCLGLLSQKRCVRRSRDPSSLRQSHVTCTL